MAYFYVKSNGTAGATTDAGRYASQQTGSFATLGTANYYASLTDAFNAGKPNPPTDGDFICISDASALSVSTSLNRTASSGASIICVSDTNCDAPAVASAAIEYITGGTGDWNPNQLAPGNTYIYGVWAKCDDDIALAGAAGSYTLAVKSTFEVTGSGDLLRLALGDGSLCVIVDCTLILGNAGSIFATSVGGGRSRLINCGFTLTGTDLITAGFQGGGGVTEFDGCDLSGVSGSIFNVTITSAVDGVFVKLNRCRLASGVQYVNSGLTLRWTHRIEVYNSAHDSSAEYQYYVRQEECIAEDDTSFYRDGSVGYPSGQKVSLKITTSANASISRPFYFDLPATYADLTSTSSDLIRYHVLSSSTLTDADIWVVAIYPDGTNIFTPNSEVSSTLTDIADAFDVFRTGTGLTTNTESWTGRTTENRYQIDIDTSADPGAKCVPIVRCFVAKPSATIYICATPELA